MWLKRYGIAIAIVIVTCGSALADPLPPISTTIVHEADAVGATRGGEAGGSPLYAHRDGQIVHYFTNDANRAAYIHNPGAYPDKDPGARLAFFGADVVARFPLGMHSDTVDPVVAGASRWTVRYQNVDYRFAFEATMLAFKADPQRFATPVGGYCLGAMSADHITPGDPRNVYFVKEEDTWAVFGSPNGPIAWGKMTPNERREKFATAVVNYGNQIAPSADDKISMGTVP